MVLRISKSLNTFNHVYNGCKEILEQVFFYI